MNWIRISMKYNIITYSLFIFAVFFLNASSYAQQANIAVKGIVTDTTGHALSSATVSLYAGKVLQKQVVSTEKGFVFNAPGPGKYMITTSFSGYRTDTLSLVIKPGDTVVNTRRISLKMIAIALQEVHIKSNVPAVTLKGDTVVYNADAFKTRPNSTVEELIRQLPGLEVDANGGITYQGKPIQYISINGRQYFLNDPKLISKNLFSDMVSKVELFDAPSKESKLAGLKDPNPGKALNLVIKKGVNLAINGKAYGGATNQADYTTGGNATSLVNDRAMFANVNTNNISDLYTGQDKLEESPTGIEGRSTVTSDALTYSDKLSRSLFVNMLYSDRFNNTTNISNSDQQTFYGGDSTQLRHNSGSSIGTGYNHSLNGEMLFTLDTLGASSLSYKPNLNFVQNKNVSSGSSSQYIQTKGVQHLTNSGTTNNTSTDRNTDINNEFAFYKNLAKRSLTLNFSQYYFQASSDGLLNSDTRFFDTDGTLLNDSQIKQRFKQVSTGNDYNINLTDNERLTSSQTLSIMYGIAAHHDEAKRSSYDFNPLTNAYDLPDTLTTNDLKNVNITQNVNLGYNYFNGNLNYRIGGGLEHILLESDDFIKDNSLEKGFLDWTGNASLNYRLGGNATANKQLSPTEALAAAINAMNSSVNKTIGLDYNVNTRPLSINEWQALPDVSNPLFIRTGNPELKPEQDHSLNLHYSSTQFKKGKSFQLSFKGIYRVNAIVTTLDLLPDGVQRSGYVNAGGLYSLSANAVFEFPMGDIKNGKLRISNMAGYLRDMSLVNEEKNTKAGLNAGQQFSALYRAGAKLELNFDGNWRYDGSHYSLQPNQNTTSLTQNYRAGFSYELPGAARVSSTYGINIYNAQVGLPVTHTMLWNAALVKNVFKNKRGECRFSAFDLLNSNSGISQGVGGNSVFRNVTNTPGRQLLLTFAYYFRPDQK